MKKKIICYITSNL